MRGYQFGAWRVEPELNRLVRDHREISLEPKSMAVLELLLERRGEVITTDEFLDHVWSGRVIEPSSVQRHIGRLRSVLQDDPRLPTYIETIRSRGYRAIAPVNSLRSTQKNTEQSSIAVLPLENLSPDPYDAFFAAGIHEELLARLAKIKSLKVISRTSVLEYLNQPKNIRKVAQELGVATILEGSVRRADETVRISVQLIDASADQHLWGETYDRELTARSVFAIQSDIATSIVGALRATITPLEAAQLGNVPTQSTRAYDFYLIGNDYFKYPDDPTTLPLARQMYERAIEEDPEFALAHAALSHVHSRFHWVGLDRTDARLKLAQAAFERAFDLAPGLPEAHLAVGEYYYRGFSEYAQALEEYAIAEQGMPGSAELAIARAEAYRRLGQWEQSKKYWERAIELDPRNPVPVFQRASTSECLRDYVEAGRYYRRGFELRPDERFYANYIPLFRDGDVHALKAGNYWLSWLSPAFYERDYAAALGDLREWDDDFRSSMFFYVPRASRYGLVYQLMGRYELSKRHFQTARSQVERAIASNAKDPLLHIALGEALAGVGEMDAAVRAARRAMELQPTSADAMVGPAIRLDAVLRVLVPAGEDAAAIEELDAYLTAPGVWSIEGILPDPRLDPIRDDPRFRDLVEKYKRR